MNVIIAREFKIISNFAPIPRMCIILLHVTDRYQWLNAFKMKYSEREREREREARFLPMKFV